MHYLIEHILKALTKSSIDGSIPGLSSLSPIAAERSDVDQKRERDQPGENCVPKPTAT
jgi:hypothetical protein